MADLDNKPATAETAGATGEKKKRKPQGPRTPQSFYVFVKSNTETGAVEVQQAFRDPRKMANHFQTAQQNGETMLVVTPE